MKDKKIYLGNEGAIFENEMIIQRSLGHHQSSLPLSIELNDEAGFFPKKKSHSFSDLSYLRKANEVDN